MSFPKHYVSYCVMDTEAGANPFNHAFLIFSKQQSPNSPVEAVDSIGYYSQPSSTTNPIIKNLKFLLGFRIDLQDSHGVLIQEQMRNLSVNGIKGVSFELNEEQFNNLQVNYTEAMRVEQETISELNQELTAKKIPANGYTRHLAEKEKADAENRKPRITPFHVTMDVTSKGFDSSKSYTCKDKALNILQENGVIDDSVVEQIISGKAKHAFPCFYSLNLQPVRLISTGERERHVSKGGKVFFNHAWGKNKLYWATPVATLETLNTLNIKEQYPIVKRLLNRITDIEQRLYNTIEKSQDAPYIAQLKIQLKRVQNLALLFANTNDYQNSNAFTKKIVTAEKVLNVAAFAMEPERINSSFLLRAYESIAAQSALLGLFAIALTATLIALAPPIGITLCALSTIATGMQMYSFYKEENAFVKTKADYELSQPLELSACAV